MYDISKLERWIGRETDVRQVGVWRDLLHDFGDVLPFLIDEKFVEHIPAVGRLRLFKKDALKSPSRTFKTYAGAAWVLMAHLDRYARLPDPFFKSGFLFPLEWKKVEKDEAGHHSELLPPALLELADKVKQQFEDNGIDVAGFYLHPWHGFRGTADFSRMSASFDSAWGALATGLFSLATADAKKGDGMLANWPFASVAFDFEGDQPMPVSHLAEKIAVVARYGGYEFTVSPNQQTELKKELEIFKIRTGTRIRSFVWKWRDGDFPESIRALARCNQARTAKRVLYGMLLTGSILGMSVLGILVVRQHDAAETALADAAYQLGLSYYNGWGTKIDYSAAASNFLFAAERGHSDAMFKIAYCYGTGQGVSYDERRRASWYRKAADRGHLHAINSLGVCYAQGIGVPQNTVKAMMLFRLAAEKGDVHAMSNFGLVCKNASAAWREQIRIWREGAANGIVDDMEKLAKCYSEGLFVETNHVEAVRLLRTAAERGSASAMNNLGRCYMDGTAGMKDTRQAFEWYLKAAEKGEGIAMLNLGGCYMNGTAVKRDERQAFEWYLKAAKKGNVQAMYNLGVCYMNGMGVEKDEHQAFKWYRKAADKGYAAAMGGLGYCYINGRGVDKDECKGVEWYRKAVDSGDMDAIFNLGICYDTGKGVEKDEHQAVECYQWAATKGYVLAMFNLGVRYQEGRGVEKDVRQGTVWYRKAAEKGYTSAMNALGSCYLKGEGVEKDESKAVYWYRLAAEGENASAMFNQAICYVNGYGVEKNLDEAEKWLRKALELGVPQAQKALDQVRKEKEATKQPPGLSAE